MKTLRWVGAALVLVGLVLLPHWVGNEYYLHQIVLIGIYGILLFGLDIVVGYTGEVSLAHAALFGIGAYTAGILNATYGVPFYATLPVSLVITAGFGLLLAFPALRVTGPYLAMVTLAFGTIARILINEMDFLTNGPLGISLQKPQWRGHGLEEGQYYEVVLVVFLLALFSIDRLLRSHIGRAFEALRGSPIACDCMGVGVYRYKVLAFAISAGFAGLAGGLYTFNELYIAPDTYNFELTILFLLALIMGGRKSRLGPVLGASIVVLLPNVLDDIQLFRWLVHGMTVVMALQWLRWNRLDRAMRRQLWAPTLVIGLLEWAAHHLQDMTEWRITIFGCLILFVIYYLPDGIMGWLRQWFEQWPWARRISRVAGPAVAKESMVPGDEGLRFQPGPGNGSGSIVLRAQGLTMQFGGLKALNEVSLTVERGTIMGLIGPNGSGKSTLMNVLTGIYSPTAGSIEFKGQSIGGKPPVRIAQQGLARTFQNLQLFGEMTVLENVLVGLHHTFRSTVFDALVHSPRFSREERMARIRARQILVFVGLEAHADEQARHLPYGSQRRLEIGRALALDPQLLLLDEPAAGLTSTEIAELIDIIRNIREQGIGVILIEHHMDVVMAISDRVAVLDFGQKIAEGVPQAVQRDPAVIQAYLGGHEEGVN